MLSIYVLNIRKTEQFTPHQVNYSSEQSTMFEVLNRGQDIYNEYSNYDDTIFEINDNEISEDYLRWKLIIYPNSGIM